MSREIEFKGKIVGEITVRQSPKTTVTNFALITGGKSIKNAQTGRWEGVKNSGVLINVTCFGTLAQEMANVDKNKMVIVVGNLYSDEYTYPQDHEKAGQVLKTLKLNANDVFTAIHTHTSKAQQNGANAPVNNNTAPTGTQPVVQNTQPLPTGQGQVQNPVTPVNNNELPTAQQGQNPSNDIWDDVDF
jgi:single-stranded DNA-binding protein